MFLIFKKLEKFFLNVKNRKNVTGIKNVKIRYFTSVLQPLHVYVEQKA